jgi:very-short-patch-repair endonuclease
VKQDKASTTRARRLRRDRTDAEAKLWAALRDRGLDGHKFRRQRPVGEAYSDFVCIERRLIVEVDGGQHAGSAKDAARTVRLGAEGYRVIRFWNNEVLSDLDGVLTEILRALEQA